MFEQQANNLPAMLSDNKQALVPMLTKLGIDQATVNRIVTFLQEHATDVQNWLSGQGAGVLQKAKEAIGGILGGKSGK
jgi:hypothetical protein